MTLPPSSGYLSDITLTHKRLTPFSADLAALREQTKTLIPFDYIMWKFLLTFTLTYGTMHALFFHRIRVLLPDNRWIHSLTIFFLILLVVAPVCSFPLERSGHVDTARVVALIGFTWMGFIFLASVLVVGMDLLDILFWLGRKATHWSLPSLMTKGPTTIMLFITILTCLYGVFEARNIQVERVTIETDKLPEGTDRLRIAQISDVHLGLLIGRSRIDSIVTILNSKRPDIIVSTGDLVDSSSSHLDGLSQMLCRMKPPYGKYAVTGNHEFYPGLEQSLAFIERAGFTVLRNQIQTIDSLITIVGVDDPIVGTKTDETALLSSAPEGLFTLFLKHRPYVPPATLGLFDLQLSGHTHNGQLFPFSYIVSIPYPYISGFYSLKKDHPCTPVAVPAPGGLPCAFSRHRK